MEFIRWFDYILLPFYLALICAIAFRFRNRNYPPGHPWRAYFMPALLAKIGGAIFISFIYQYYYGSGDTGNFFEHARVINSAFTDSPVKWLNLVLRIPAWYDGEYYEYTSRLIWYQSPNNYFVGSVAAVIGMLCFTSYLPISLLFAAGSFTGVWAMFRTFARQYPHLLRPVAIAVLFIPSTIIWGSGLFKDTICIFGLGWLLYGTFEVLIQRRLRTSSLILALVGGYLVYSTKLYILAAFIPALLVWVLFSYSYRMQSPLLRFFVSLGIIGVTAGVMLLFSDRIGEQLGQFSTENLLKTSAVMRDYIYSISGDQGSAYSLGEFDPTLAGVLKKFPQAVNVTLYRPYIWEARKPIVMLNALEASLFLLLSLRILFLLGPSRVWRAIAGDPTIQFCLIFTVIFGFAVGISSYNFGALSRYRIPCLPMFGLALMLIYYRYFPASKPLFGIRLSSKAVAAT